MQELKNDTDKIQDIKQEITQLERDLENRATDRAKAYQHFFHTVRELISGNKG